MNLDLHGPSIPGRRFADSRHCARIFPAVETFVTPPGRRKWEPPLDRQAGGNARRKRPDLVVCGRARPMDHAIFRHTQGPVPGRSEERDHEKR